MPVTAHPALHTHRCILVTPNPTVCPSLHTRRYIPVVVYLSLHKFYCPGFQKRYFLLDSRTVLSKNATFFSVLLLCQNKASLLVMILALFPYWHSSVDCTPEKHTLRCILVTAHLPSMIVPTHPSLHTLRCILVTAHLRCIPIHVKHTCHCTGTAWHTIGTTWHTMAVQHWQSIGK